jgi:hypothetical protein
MMGATGAAEKITARLDSMADDFAATMFAGRSQGVNRTLETIKIMGDPVYNHLKRFVIVIPADFTLHKITLNGWLNFEGFVYGSFSFRKSSRVASSS